MSDKFDRLNRETREFNNGNVNHLNTPKKPVYSQQYQNYLNNQTYKQNNGQYSKHYF